MIREMRQEDMKRIEEIWLEDSVALHNFVPDPGKFWPRILPEFREGTLRGTTYVCEAAGAVNGFITIWLPEYYIPSLYVDLHLRGQGIGSALLDEARKLNHPLYLDVYQKDVPAVCFYLRRGFTMESKRLEDQTKEFKYRMEWNVE
jgi:putative acetyltransferase